MTKDSSTCLISPERSDQEEIKDNFNKIIHTDYIKHLLNSTLNYASILNHNKQIVFLNKSLMAYLNLEDFNKVIGLRPGEAISCIHSAECSGGCGTSKHCYLCGCAQAIVESQEKNVQVTKECMIVTRVDNKEKNLDLSITATPLKIDDQIFTTIIITDISDQKRKVVLEKIFFHDVMNTATSIYGFIKFINQLNGIGEIKELTPIVESASSTLIDQINEQRDLLFAESGELKLTIKQFNSINILNECNEIISKHDVAKNKYVKMDDNSESIEIENCQTTLKRVLINMIKNALESSKENQTVTTGCKSHNSKVIFWVHNETCIPEEIQMQIFQRSFTTKGRGRGLGTYSVKLLTHKYLKGQVSFKSVESEGTTFFIEINEVYPS